MGQRKKCLPCQHGALSSGPQRPWRSRAQQHVSVNLVLGMGQRQTPTTPPAELEPQVQRETLSQNTKQKVIGEDTQCQPLADIHTRMWAHRLTSHTH